MLQGQEKETGPDCCLESGEGYTISNHAYSISIQPLHVFYEELKVFSMRLIFVDMNMLGYEQFLVHIWILFLMKFLNRER